MQIIAHRGASGYEPENTLASFKKALTMGVDMIELDVHVLQTGELVVIHDETVDRTTDGTGHVVNFSLEQLRTLDAGDGQKIPLLSEVLDLVDKRVPINIELKGEHTAVPTAAMIQQYIDEKGWDEDLFVVSSFNHRELKKFIKSMPHIRTGALYDGEPDRFLSFARRPSTYSTNFDSVFVTNKDVYRAHTRGFRVYVYTVNDPDEAERMRKMHVDGIFTNYPDRMAAALSHA
ncbi:MAG TPA: glycerophosphodiester phosphodiesterase family protein [Candidatus Saccharimonadales bacterium]|nr:glycerophosphodiester phosphodiesterase family protein [Candidatus Saccharimonadales bacterium]